jgi:hypothetical protein
LGRASSFSEMILTASLVIQCVEISIQPKIVYSYVNQAHTFLTPFHLEQGPGVQPQVSFFFLPSDVMISRISLSLLLFCSNSCLPNYDWP